MELWGFEPQTSSMPCMKVSSDAIALGRVTAGRRNCGVRARRTSSAVAWRRCHLLCHWIQGSLLQGFGPLDHQYRRSNSWPWSRRAGRCPPRPRAAWRTSRYPLTLARRLPVPSLTTGMRSSWRCVNRPDRSPPESSDTTPSSAREDCDLPHRPGWTQFELVFHMTETSLLQVHAWEAESRRKSGSRFRSAV